MKLIDYLANTPNDGVVAVLEVPGYSYPAFIRGLKSSLGEDMQKLDERWLRDLTDPELHKAYDFYLHYCDAPKQRLAA